MVGSAVLWKRGRSSCKYYYLCATSTLAAFAIVPFSTAAFRPTSPQLRSFGASLISLADEPAPSRFQEKIPGSSSFGVNPATSRTSTASTSTSSSRIKMNDAMEGADETKSPVPLMPGSPTWHQTMLRVKDANASVQFYRDILGMTLIDTMDFPQYQFRLYFLTTLPTGETYPFTPGTAEAHNFLWTYPGVTLELTHNYGTESQHDFAYHTGNQEKDGFGHIAVNVVDVYATCEKLQQLSIPFQKKPDEGRMKVQY